MVVHKSNWMARRQQLPSKALLWVPECKELQKSNQDFWREAPADTTSAVPMAMLATIA